MEPNLPPEILEYIFKQYPELLLKSRTLSHSMLNLMIHEYSKLKLSNPITYYEIQDYLNTEPSTFAYFELKLPNDECIKTLTSYLFYNKISPNWYHLILGNASVSGRFLQTFAPYTPKHFFSTPVNSSCGSELFIEELNFASIIEFDILTIYNIYNKRLLFNENSKTYSKNKILQDFNYIVTTGYLTWSKLEILSILMLNVYLSINAFILGVITLEDLYKLKFNIPYYKLEYDVNCNIINFELNPPDIVSTLQVEIYNLNQILIHHIRQKILNFL